MNSNQMDYWPPKVHFHPGKLTDLAAVSFVAAILHNKVVHMRENGWHKFYDNALDLAQVSIPNALRKTIDRLIDKMETNRTAWWTYHGRCVLLNTFRGDDMIDWLCQLIWLPDGSIDYRKTAIEMLNCEKVPNVRKFQLACSYCFVDQVELLKKSLTVEEICDATKKYRKVENEIMNYWGARLSGWCREYKIKDLSSLIDRIIEESKYYDDVWGIEYFFNQLENEKRLLKIQTIIGRNEPTLIWHLLPRLTGPELDFLIENKSLEIMDALVKNPRYFEYTISIWKRMVNLIDDETLVKIIHRINCLAPSTHQRTHINPILWEIWLATSERQKKVIVDQTICDFTEEMDKVYHEYYYSPNFPLILDVLSRFDPERRYKYFSKHWPYLTVGQFSLLDNRNFIDRIMKLCIPNDQIETFKSTIMIDYDSIAKSCEYLIMYGRVKDVTTYLEFCSSDQRIIHDLKKKIMTKTPEYDIFDFLFYHSNSENLLDFYRYLDDVFTKEESEEFLNNIVTNPYILKQMRSMLSNKLQKVVQFVEKFVTSEQALAKVKHNFFEKCRRQNFERRSVFLDLIAWCFNLNKAMIEKNNALMEEFKKLPPSEYEASNITMDEFDSPIHITFLEPYARLIGDENSLWTILSLKY